MRGRKILTLVVVLGIAVLTAAYLRQSGRGATDGSAKSGPSIIPVETQIVNAADFKIRRRAIGTLESPATVIIRSRIDSLVLQQHVTDGQIVKKGELLFTLDDREIQAVIARDQATIAKDQAALAQSESALARTQQLSAKDIASQQQLEQATATFKAAQQTVEADQAVLQADQLKLGYGKLMAPMDGRIGAIRVAPGNVVSTNDAVGFTTLTQMKPLRVSFSLPERDLTALRQAARATQRPEVRIYPSGESEPVAKGVLDFVDSSVDSTSGTIAAKATFPNEKYELLPGQYVDVEIDLQTRPNTIIVPTVALLTGQKGPYVYVAKADGTVEIRQVEIAGVDGNQSAIGTGIVSGERVVIQGQLRLTPTARWAEAAKTEAVAPEIKSKDGVQPSPAKAAVR